LAGKGFDERVYTRIGLDDLVTFGVFSLKEKGKEATFENLVVECFGLFPKRFGLVGYPMYPDSALVNKSWLRCRTDKHLIDGSAAKGFRLTPIGLEVVKKTLALLKDSRGQVALGRVKEEERSRASKFVRHVQNSAAFRKYAETGGSQISDFELRDVLLGTMQTEPEVLLDSALQLKAYAKAKERDDLVRFLEYVEGEVARRFTRFSDAPRYEGGMNRKRSKPRISDVEIDKPERDRPDSGP
jgi:hypothetical protein